MRPVCRIHPAGGCTCCSPPAVKGAQVIMKESKTALFQQAMPEGMEAALFEDPSNRYYFTEMRSSAGAVLITRKSAVFWIDFRYFEQALEVVTDAEVREEKDRSAQVRQFLEEVCHMTGGNGDGAVFFTGFDLYGGAEGKFGV